MSKLSIKKSIDNLVSSAEKFAKAEIKRDMYLMIKDLQDKGVKDEEIVKEMLAFCLGNKRDEMLFEP
jgi:hypothetical protein